MADAARRTVHVTPAGLRALREEYERLRTERHRVVEVVSWAAGNGDRSENADYKEGKRRLREIDRRLRYLGRQVEDSVVVNPAAQPRRDRVFFGATVTYLTEEDERRTVTIVGVDEADATAGRISLNSPIARALMGAQPGKEVTVQLPAGPTTVLVEAIAYPEGGAA
ncbi:GreA/GreB family elongation factor [Roseomonas sp. CCTCC AB2023176]|uniref:GreA/GreB family elongation factor n=1 Tax=Roseomonas sp. CCTCC AB2023176 TaxID=3342640 RepID=UPI0035D55B3D